jgi:hypothetical protein
MQPEQIGYQRRYCSCPDKEAA